jgi:hypothetical protein
VFFATYLDAQIKDDIGGHVARIRDEKYEKFITKTANGRHHLGYLGESSGSKEPGSGGIQDGLQRTRQKPSAFIKGGRILGHNF